MFRANDLLGKTIVNQATGERLPAVSDVVFSEDGRSVVALLAGGGLLSQARVLRWPSVASIGDVVMAQGVSTLPRLGDDAEVSALHSAAHRITGVKVINSAGAQIGEVGDIFIDEGGHVVGYEVKHGLLSGSSFLSAAQVQTLGKDALIANVADASALQRVSDIERELGS